MTREPFTLGNIKAFFAMREMLKRERFTLVHCHTPVGGVVTRLAAIGLKNKPHIFYTAHGFHFYSGAPLVNWLLYYPLEYLLAGVTDHLITINHEDYKRVKKDRFPARALHYVPGIGVDMQRFAPLDAGERARRRNEFGFKANELLFFLAAEFIPRKNHALLIAEFSAFCQKNPLLKAKLVLAGEGPELERCRELAERYHVASRVVFLGYRTDIAELLPCMDAVVSASLQEGLPVNVLEALACGLPVIASDIRGHRDLVVDGVNGFLVKTKAPKAFAYAMSACVELLKNPDLNAYCRGSVQHCEKQRVLEMVVRLYK